MKKIVFKLSAIIIALGISSQILAQDPIPQLSIDRVGTVVMGNETQSGVFKASGPEINASVSEINFGDQFINTSADQVVTIENIGSDTLKISNITSNTSQFTNDLNSFELLSGESVDILVTFSPTSVEYLTGILSIESNDQNITVDLIGNGILAPGIVLSESTINSSILSCGGNSTGSFIINNSGPPDLNYSIMAIDENEALASWISFSDPIGVVSGYGTQAIDVTFDASSLNAGEYSATIIISSNDPLNPQSTISANLTVNGGAILESSVSSIDFGEVFVYGTKLDTIQLTNSGCSELEITNILSSHNVVSVDDSYFTINPYGTHEVIVMLEPTESGILDGFLTIESNYGNLQIPFTSTMVTPPEFFVNKKVVSAMFAGCGGIANTDFNIENIGGDSLTFVIPMVGGVESSIETIYLGGNGQNGNMFNISTTKEITISALDISCQSQNTVYNMEVYYKSGSYVGFEQNAGAWTLASSTSVTSTSLNLSPTYIDIDDIVLPPGDYALYITNTNGNTLNYTNGANTYTDGVVSIQTGAGKQYPFSATFSPRTWNGTIYYATGSGPGWLTLSQTGDTLVTSEKAIIDVAMNSNGLKSGVYNHDIIVHSNDPVNTADTITFEFTVETYPEISASASALDFGELMVNAVGSQFLAIENTGCDTLKVTDIVSDVLQFSVDVTQFNLLPSESRDVIVSFTPNSTESYSGELTISNNDEEVIVALSGSGIPAPGLVLSESSLATEVFACGESASSSFAVNNGGSADLNYNISARDQYGNIANWVSFNQTGGTVGAYSTNYIDVTFNAANLNAGVYNANILVNSNDPLVPQGLISTTFTVNGDPIPESSVSSIDFGKIFVNASVIDTFYIRNNGCDILNIIDVSLSHSVVQVAMSDMYVLPNDSAEIIVSYSPIEKDFLNGNIIIENDVQNIVINISGEAVIAPEMFVSQTLISNEVNTCYDSVSNIFTISNTGAEDLTYSFEGSYENKSINVAVYNNGGVATVLNKADDITATAVSTYNSSILANYDVLMNIRTSNLNQSDVLNFILNGGVWIGEWTSNEIPVNNWGVISGSVGGGAGGSQSVNIIDPNHYLAKEIDWANMPVGEGPTDYMRNLHGINDPSSNIIVTVNHNSYPNNPLIVEKQYGLGKIILLNWDYQDQPNYNAIVEDLIQEVVRYGARGNSMPPWLNTNPSTGVVHAGESADVDVEFNAKNLSEGFYEFDIIVKSNDPVNSSDTIACNFNVNYNPEFTLDQESLSYGDVYLNNTYSQTIEVSNTGCDLLEVTGFNTSNTDFTVATAPFNLEPGESQMVNVNYYPSIIGHASGVLTIITNDSDGIVSLSGNGVAAKLLSVSTSTSDGAYSDGDVIDITVTFDRVVDVDISNGTPVIKLNTNPVKYANYVSGSGTTNLLFEYTVGSNENVSTLDYNAETDLMLQNATIQYQGEDAGVTLPVVGNFSSVYSIEIDNIHPTAAITSLADYANTAVQVNLIFNEPVNGFNLTDLQLTNATASNLSTVTAGLEYTFDVTGSSEGKFMVQIPADVRTDFAGNNNAASNELTLTYDITSPLPTISSQESVLTNENPLIAYVEFDEEVMNFTDADILVSNGTIESFAEAISGKLFKIEIAPLADGIVAIDINANVANDLASNLNSAAAQFNIDYDGTDPTGTITSIALNANNRIATPIFDINITFDENVTGFTESDISVSNATITNFTEVVSGLQYTADITASQDGEIPIRLLQGIVVDDAGNFNMESELIAYFDTTAPSVVLTSLEGPRTNQDPFKVIATFDEPVSGFTIGGFIVTDGVASNFTVIEPNLEYSIDITPDAEDTVFVDINADIATDDFGLLNKAADQLEVIYDITAPIPSITLNASNPTNQSPFSINIAFNENVYGFTLGGVQVSNGVASNLVEVVSNKQYTADITPIAEGTVSINIAANSGKDMAGNLNSPSSVRNVVYELAKPTVLLSSNVDTYTNLSEFLLTIEFSEFVNGFDVNDLVLTNSTAGALSTITSGVKYSVVISPIDQGNVVVSMNANAVSDQIGNGNDAATPLSVVFDNVMPEVVLSSTVGTSTNQSPFNISIVFNEEVLGFDISDLRVTNANVSGLTEVVTNKEYTAIVTPKQDGEVKVELMSYSVEDMAQNGNSEATPLIITYDGTEPIVNLSTNVGAYTNQSPIEVVIRFSEEITGFSLDDISVVNGSASNLVEVISGVEFTVSISPNNNSQVSIKLNYAVAVDLIGNNTQASNTLIINYDADKPTVSISSEIGIATNKSVFNVNVVFSESVVGFSSANMVVTNGRVGTIIEKVTNTEYSVSIIPSTDGTVTVNIPADVVADNAGNSNSAAHEVSVLFDKMSPEFISVNIDIITDITADFLMTVDEDATVYYALLTRNASAPAFEQLLNNDLSDAIESGNIGVIGSAEEGLGFISLTKGARYTLYLIAEDNIGNRSGIYDIDFSTSSVGVDSEAVSSLVAYPNPSNGEFIVEFSDESYVGQELKVLSLAGKLLTTVKIDETKQTINISEFEQGYYILQVSSNNRVENLRIVIE